MDLQVLRIWLVCYGFTSFKDMAWKLRKNTVVHLQFTTFPRFIIKGFTVLKCRIFYI